jgi:hypothetical protein
VKSRLGFKKMSVLSNGAESLVQQLRSGKIIKLTSNGERTNI